MTAEKLRTKLPDRKELLPVFSTILFFVFTWALYIIIYYLPSWLGELTAGDILVTAAYLLSFTLFESLFVLGVIVLLCIVLPTRIFKRDFIPQSFTLITLASLAAYFLHPRLNDMLSLDLTNLTILMIATLAGILVLIIMQSFVYKHLPGLKLSINTLADRMTIFAYFYLPLGLLSLFIVTLKILC